MLAISVELLHGTFRGDPDGTANTGHLTRGEWPPSPARLFAALVAADGTRDRCRVTDGAELAWFERLPPPVIHAHARPCHQPLKPRYVVRHKGSADKGSHQEYVGRIGVLNRAGARVAPRDPRVVYAWDVESPPREVLDALRLRAARVGYLGASDSPVRVRVATRLSPTDAPSDLFTPDRRGGLVIDTPVPGRLQVLDRMYDEWCTRGASVSRLQFPALQQGQPYRSPGSAEPVDRGEVVAWLRLGAAVSGRRLSAVTALFKEAVLSRHQSIHGEPPAILHGHGFNGSGYEVARYLALPDVGYRWSRGRIHGLGLWMPPDCDLLARQRARDAAFAIRRLDGSGRRRVRCSPRGRGAAARDPSGPLAPPLPRLGDGVPGDPRAPRHARSGRSRALVPSRRSVGTDGLSLDTNAAGRGSGRPGASGSEPAGPASTALLACRAPVRRGRSGTGRDRFRPAARLRALRTGG